MLILARHANMYVKVKVLLHEFFTSAVDGIKRSTSHPNCLIPGKLDRIRACLDAVKNDDDNILSDRTGNALPPQLPS